MTRRPMPKRSRYDDVVQALRKNLEAAGVLLVVVGGNRGPGCVSSVRAEVHERWRAVIPTVLRALADDIERGETPGELHTAHSRSEEPDA